MQFALWQPFIRHGHDFMLLHLANLSGQALSRPQNIEVASGYTSDLGSERTVNVPIRRLRGTVWIRPQLIQPDPDRARHWLQAVGPRFFFPVLRFSTTM
jgi:hypothetical protein